MRRTRVIATAALGTALATVLATVLGLATAAGAADWRTNPDTYESGLFLDMSSYKILPSGSRQIWILQAFQKPIKISGGSVDFQVTLYEFDCLGRTAGVKYNAIYFMDGKSNSSEPNLAASPLPSDPIADRMSGVVCGDMSRLTAVAGEASVIAHRYRAIGKMALQYQ